MKMRQHPLGWLLALCDELQCWDRTAYGRNSRTELHPMGAEFDFSNNAVSAVYYYDENDMVYKETVEYIGLDVEWNEGYTVYYSDWVYDSQGNWVKRSAHSSTYGDSQESRKIIYY